MPIEFMNCYKGGGKIRTKKLSGGRIQKICYNAGNAYPGHIEKPKKKTKKKRK